MKAFVAFCLLALLAVAGAQQFSAEDLVALRHEQSSPFKAEAQKEYVSEVEYADRLESEPHPSLVPHYFLEHEHAFARRHQKKGGAEKKQTAAARDAKKAMKKVQALSKKAQTGDKQAAKQLKRQQSKLDRKLKKAGANASSILKKKARRARRKARKALRKARKGAEAAKSAKSAADLEAEKAHNKLRRAQEKTDRRVQRAMEKLRHVSSNMNHLAGLLKTIHQRVDSLLPEGRVKGYANEDVSKVSNSRRGTLGKHPQNTLTNPYSKDQSHSALYSNQIIPPSVRPVKKHEDMNAQELAAAQRDLGKFTHKLAAADTVALV